MRFSTARSLTLATLVPVLVLALVAPGCAKQSEGERCGDSLGAGASDDCGDGLTCTLSSKLINNEGAHRCCYTDGSVTDSRCELKDTAVSPSGGASSGGSGGTGGGATATAGSTEEAGAGS